LKKDRPGGDLEIEKMMGILSCKGGQSTLIRSRLGSSNRIDGPTKGGGGSRISQGSRGDDFAAKFPGEEKLLDKANIRTGGRGRGKTKRTLENVNSTTELGEEKDGSGSFGRKGRKKKDVDLLSFKGSKKGRRRGKRRRSGSWGEKVAGLFFSRIPWMNSQGKRSSEKKKT